MHHHGFPRPLNASPCVQTWVLLFRGINVGGNNMLPMAKLRADLESLGLKNVRTYIQSGNVVFESKAKTATAMAKKISTHIAKEYGFQPHLLFLQREVLLGAIDANPFPKAVKDPTTLHFFFLESPAASADLKALDSAKTGTETYRLTDAVFYLHAPDGIGRSKLAASAEKHLGVVTTARNYRTVEKLVEMAALA